MRRDKQSHQSASPAYSPTPPSDGPSFPLLKLHTAKAVKSSAYVPTLHYIQYSREEVHVETVIVFQPCLCSHWPEEPFLSSHRSALLPNSTRSEGLARAPVLSELTQIHSGHICVENNEIDGVAGAAARWREFRKKNRSKK